MDGQRIIHFKNKNNLSPCVWQYSQNKLWFCTNIFQGREMILVKDSNNPGIGLGAGNVGLARDLPFGGHEGVGVARGLPFGELTALMIQLAQNGVGITYPSS